MLKWICVFTIGIQPLSADQGHRDGSANMDRYQEQYEDEKPTLYDRNQGEMEEDSLNWNRAHREDDTQAEAGSCSSGSCHKHRKLQIEDD